jgi:hypothetical protein
MIAPVKGLIWVMGLGDHKDRAYIIYRRNSCRMRNKNASAS